MPKKSTALAVKPEQPIGLISGQGKKIMEAMTGEIPAWALDKRPGRGGKTFTYVSHGYVTSKMNDVFGPFWDLTSLPVSGNKNYEVVEYEEKGKHIREVATLVRITVRIYDPNGVLLETISRDGDGGKVWEEGTTFADALQASRSDAFKRAAFRFGDVFGLKLYYDDDERQDIWEAQNTIKPPTNLITLFSRLQELGISDEVYTTIVGHDPYVTKDFQGDWDILITALEGGNDGQGQILEGEGNPKQE